MHQPVAMLGQRVRIEGFDRVDDLPVQRALPIVQQAAVGHLVGQRVLEGELDLGKQPRLVDELRRLQVREPARQDVLREPGDCAQLGQRSGKRLNHLPSGTSGSVSSHTAKSSN